MNHGAPPRRILAGEPGGPSSHHARHVQHIADEPATTDPNRIVRLHGNGLAARHPIERVWKIQPGIDGELQRSPEAPVDLH